MRTFTDFLQAKMQPQNQLILPNSTVLNEGSYQFYLQGRQLHELEKTRLRDETEDRLRT